MRVADEFQSLIERIDGSHTVAAAQAPAQLAGGASKNAYGWLVYVGIAVAALGVALVLYLTIFRRRPKGAAQEKASVTAANDEGRGDAGTDLASRIMQHMAANPIPTSHDVEARSYIGRQADYYTSTHQDDEATATARAAADFYRDRGTIVGENRKTTDADLERYAQLRAAQVPMPGGPPSGAPVPMPPAGVPMPGGPPMPSGTDAPQGMQISVGDIVTTDHDA